MRGVQRLLRSGDLLDATAHSSKHRLRKKSYISKHSIHLTGRLWKVRELVVLRFRLELFFFFFAKYFAF